MKPTFPEVFVGYRGAPMGRTNDPITEPVTIGQAHLVPLRDGYDPGGAYWGQHTAGSLLYVAVLPDGGQSYVRAAALDMAVVKFNERLNPIKR